MIANETARWPTVIGEAIAGSKPQVLRACARQLPFHKEEVLQIFCRLCYSQLGKLSPSLRVFQEGRLEELEYRLLNSSPDSFQDLDAWFHSLFNNIPTAVILNKAESWSLLASEFLAAIRTDLRMRYKEVELEAVIIMGNYGYSPFGAHLDAPGTRVVHVPLTATRKRMYLWSEDDFFRVTNRQRRFYSPAEIITSGELYEFSAGDVFYLPPDYYHVGYSPDFTATLTAVLTPKRSIDHMSCASAALLSAFGENWASNSYVHSMTVAELLELSKKHQHLVQESNCGLSTTISPTLESSAIDDNQEYILPVNFRVHYDSCGGLVLYLRGRTVRLDSTLRRSHAEQICGLLELLNARHPLSVRLATLLAPLLDRGAVQFLFELLAKHHLLVPYERSQF